jgi:PadR family transcriptional regulator, regulatory protein PadR
MMPDDDLLGTFEQLVLLALLRLGEDANGMTVRREIEARAGRAASPGAVYATLDRLEAKGYVSARTGEPAPQRRGRARRFFRVEPPGHAALRHTLGILERMREGLEADGRPIGAFA